MTETFCVPSVSDGTGSGDDLAVGVHGDEGAGRVVLGVPQRLVDRVVGLLLQALVEGGLHAQTTPQHSVFAVRPNELPADIVDVVLGARRRGRDRRRLAL